MEREKKMTKKIVKRTCVCGEVSHYAVRNVADPAVAGRDERERAIVMMNNGKEGWFVWDLPYKLTFSPKGERVLRRVLLGPDQRDLRSSYVYQGIHSFTQAFIIFFHEKGREVEGMLINTSRSRHILREG